MQRLCRTRLEQSIQSPFSYLRSCLQAEVVIYPQVTAFLTYHLGTSFCDRAGLLRLMYPTLTSVFGLAGRLCWLGSQPREGGCGKENTNQAAFW